MSTLTEEVRHVQNPALGGVLIWRFACGYTNHHKTTAPPPLPLVFVVLPILFHSETLDVLKRTNRPSGLHGFADKFSRSDEAKGDILLGIHTRATAWRKLTRESLQLGLLCRLITISSANGTVIPLSNASPSGVPASISPLIANAEKLGEWCGDLTLFEIGSILKVGF